MATNVVPISTIAGALDGFVGQDRPFSTIPTNQNPLLRSFNFTVADAPSGGTLTIQLGYGVLAPIDIGPPIVLADGELQTDVAFDPLISLPGPGTLWYRITENSGGAFGALSGWVLLSDEAVGVIGPNLTNLARVKREEGIAAGATQHDISLTALIEGVSRAMEGYMGRIIGTTEYTEKLSSIGDYALRTNERPIVSVADFDTTNGNGTDLVEGVDFEVEPFEGLLYRLSSGRRVRWAAGRYAYKIVYDAGWSTIPSDLETAATHQVRHEFAQLKERDHNRLGLTARDLPTGGQITFAVHDFLPAVIRAMAPYRRSAGW